MGLFSRKTTVHDSGLLCGAADRHSHILWGVDDGVKTSAETLETLSFLGECGLGDLWLTPHTAEDVPNTTEGLKARFAELEALYAGPVMLHLASEYMLDTLYERHLEERDLLTMEGDTVLVETSTWNPPVGMAALLKETMAAGYRPLLAHPERYRYMEMEDYGRLAGMGVRLQLNLPSLRERRDRGRHVLLLGLRLPPGGGDQEHVPRKEAEETGAGDGEESRPGPADLTEEVEIP